MTKPHSIRALVLAALCVLVFAPSAHAAHLYSSSGSFSGAGTDPGQLTNPGDAAVEPGTGNLFVADSGNGRVQVFDPSHNLLTEFGSTELDAPRGIAISSVGGQTLVYVSDPATNQIVRYASDEAATPSFTVDSGFTSPAAGSGPGQVGNFAAALAIDPVTHGLLVADPGDNRVQRYDADGGYQSELDGLGSSSLFTGLLDVAVDSTGRVYVVDSDGPITGLPDSTSPSGQSRVVRFGADGTFEKTLAGLTRPATVAVDADSDEVVVSATQDAVYLNQAPSLHIFSPSGSQTQELSLDAANTTVHGLAIDASVPRIYAVLDYGYYSGSPYGSASISVLDGVLVPDVTVEPVGSAAVPRPVTVTGTVSPLGQPTSYHFEYRVVGAAGWTRAIDTDQDAGSGTAAVVVHAELSQLLALHDYEFRLVATGASASATTPLETFSTRAAAPTVVARQAALRTTTSARLQANVDPNFQSTTHYFEYGTDTSYGSVSPAQPVYTGSTLLQGVSRVIDGLQAGTTYHYRVVATNQTGTSFGADRTVATLVAVPTARVYEQVTPISKNGVDLRSNNVTERNFAVAAAGDSIQYVANGSYGDAPTSLFNTYYRADRGSDAWASTPTDIPTRNKLHPGALAWYGSTVDVSEDLSHSVVTSERALTPGAVDDAYNIYLHDNVGGGLQLIFTTPIKPINWSKFTGNVLAGNGDFSHVIFVENQALTPNAPDNGVGKLYEFTGGHLRLASIMPDGTPATEPVYYDSSAPLTHMISRDGSRIFFSLGESGDVGSAGLFVREDGQTRPISVSQRAGDGPEVRSGRVHDASADGSVVYFTSHAPLTDTTTGSLYRYDLVTGSLINLPADRELSGGLLAASRDGQRVYFTSGLKLTPTAVSGAYNVYVWHAGQLQLVVAETGPGAGTGGPGGYLGPDGVGNDDGGNFRLSPDGRLALFTAWEKTPDYDNVNPAVCRTEPGNPLRPNNQCQKLYFFDPDAEGTLCVSCNPNGGRTAGDARLGQGDARSITNDGRVFFNSPDRLVAGDVNGKYDAYQWHDGELSLISAGTGDTDSVFVNASDDGRDVFFATRDQLVGQDTDNVRDIYDAREGGGLPGQARAKASPPCEGDDCQPVGSGKPVPASIGTLTFTGSGSGADEALVAVSRSKVSVSRPKAVKGSRGVLAVKVPGTGRVTVSGSGIATVKRSVSRAATVSITVSLTSKARSALKKRHRFTTTLRAVFKPSAGPASTAKVALTFTAASAKEGR
jgi:hypothetical protein